MAGPIHQAPDKMDKDFLVIQDEDGKDVIRITRNGELMAPDDWNVADNALAFWDTVLEFVPKDGAEQIERFGMLARAFGLLNVLKNNKCIDTKALDQNPKIRTFYDEVSRELEDFFKG